MATVDGMARKIFSSVIQSKRLCLIKFSTNIAKNHVVVCVSFFSFFLHRNVQCGTLQCKEGERQPVNEGDLYSRTIISIKGLEYECK